jgi:hypothetical protein
VCIYVCFVFVRNVSFSIVEGKEWEIGAQAKRVCVRSNLKKAKKKFSEAADVS